MFIRVHAKRDNFDLVENEELQNARRFSAEPSKKFWLCFAFLFLAVALFCAKTVPFGNELVYLPRLMPDFLPNDWTYSQPANEHWLFNFLFGFPARFLSLETLGWAGRIAVWILCLISLIKLGRRWGIPYWTIAVSIFLWLASAQSVVGDEWIFGGFEAKTAAYVCLLFSLLEFSKRRIILPAVLLGLSFSFHPAIGFWAMPAIGLALLIEKTPAIDLAKIAGIAASFALIGLIPLLTEQTSAATNSFDDWQFVVLYRVPWHLDLFQFSKSGMILIFVMLGFNYFALRKNENFALRFLLKFQVSLAVFFALGFLLRGFEAYPLLRLMPMRLFPIFTPLFFIFTIFYTILRLNSKQNKIIVLLFAVLIIAALNPFGKGFNQIRETVQTWKRAPDDFQKVSLWIAENTPPKSIVIQPPNRRDVWCFSRRATVASFAYPTFNRLSEWRGRVADLSGNFQISKGETAGEEIEAAFNNLAPEQIEQLKNKYAATHLVSRKNYSYPIIFETETYKVYRLP